MLQLLSLMPITRALLILDIQNVYQYKSEMKGVEMDKRVNSSFSFKL